MPEKKYNLQLLLTKEEFEQVKAEADRLALPVPLYLRSRILPDDPYTTAYQKLLDKVDALPGGTRFNIRALFGVEWTMSDGIKRNLGRSYYRKVDSGRITNVCVVGKDSSNVMWYEKK